MKRRSKPRLKLVKQVRGIDERQQQYMHRNAMALVAHAVQVLRLPSLFDEDTEEITSIRPRRRISHMPPLVVQRRVNQALREWRIFSWSQAA